MTNGYSTFDLLQWLHPDAIAAFKEAVRVRKYRAGQIIYLQGDPGTRMYRLLSGSVSFIVNRADGREMVFTIFKPGDCFGDSSLVDQGPRPQTAEALTDVELEVLNNSDFQQLRVQFKSFDDALLRSVTRQLRLLCDYFEDASLNTLKIRVASRIVSAAESFGFSHPDGLRLSIPLSQSELASMVSASRQSVNKVLQSFQSDRLLRIEYGNLLILDLDGIRACSTRQH